MKKKYRGPMDYFYNIANQLISTKKEMKDIFDTFKAKEKQNKIFLIYEENNQPVKITYIEFVNKVIEYAKNYQAILSNVEKGSFIGFKLPNSPQWLMSFWALLMIGYKPLLINSLIDKDGTEKIIHESCIQTIISNDNFDYDIKKYNLPISLDSTLPLTVSWENEVAFCTSGTTGDSRIYIYNGQTLCNQIYAAYDMPKYTNDIMYVGNSIRLITIIPFAHIFGFIAIFLWYSFFGMTLVFPNSLNPNDIVKCIKKYKCTHIYAVPLFWNTVVRKFEIAKKSLSAKEKNIVEKMISYNNEEITATEAGIARFNFVQNKIKDKVLGKQIVFCISGGGNISKSTLRTVNGLGYPLYNGYGMTEIGVTSVELTFSAVQRNKGSVGLPLYNVEYKLANDELLVKSPYIHVGRFSNGIRKASLIDSEGYFHTGDIAYIDEKGFAYIKGKIKEVIINEDGENVYPDEIEAKFATLENIDSLSVISKEENGKSIIVLVIHLTKDLNEEELQKLYLEIQNINDCLILSNRIKKVIISKNSLPINSSMKIKKYELNDELKNNPTNFIEFKENASLNNDYFEDEKYTETLKIVISICSKVFNISEKKIAPNSNVFLDLFGDSFSYMELIGEIEEIFNITLPTEKIGKILTPKDLSIEICKLVK